VKHKRGVEDDVLAELTDQRMRTDMCDTEHDFGFLLGCEVVAFVASKWDAEVAKVRVAYGKATKFFVQDFDVKGRGGFVV
jgi:uncharacterized membrane protein